VINKYNDNFRERQHGKDPERWFKKGAAHNPVSYAIWNSKPALLAEAAQHNVFKTEYLIWLDAGIARGADWDLGTQWPEDDKVKQVFRDDEDRVMVSVMDFASDGLRGYHDVNDPRPGKSDLIQGAIFGGRVNSILWFNATYCDLMQTHIERGDFVGREETNFNLIAMVHPTRFVALREGMGKWSSEAECGGKWFAFLLIFTTPSLRPPECLVPDVISVRFETLINRRWLDTIGWFPKMTFWAGVVSTALTVLLLTAAVYTGKSIYRRRQLKRQTKQSDYERMI